MRCLRRYFLTAREAKSFNLARERVCMRTILQKYPIPALLVMFLALFGCRSTRHLEPGQFLIKSQPSVRKNQSISTTQVLTAIQTKANTRVLLPKAALYYHNTGRSLEKAFLSKQEPILSGEQEVKGVIPKFVRWLKFRVGEPPRLADAEVLEQDVINIRNLCFANGYFFPEISYKVDTLRHLLRPKVLKKKVKIAFEVKEGAAYRIKDVALVIPDSNEYTASLRSSYQLPASLVRRDARYSHDLFYQERVRATNNLRNSGYFGFSQEWIRFSVDTLGVTAPEGSRTTPGDKWMNVEIRLSHSPSWYRIREIQVFVRPPGAETGTASRDNLYEIRASDLNDEDRKALGLPASRLDSAHMTFFVDAELLKQIHFNFLSRRIHLAEGALYRQEKANLTYQRLQELGMFSVLLINYRPIEGREEMDVQIELQLAPRFQVKAGAETFTRDIISTNLPGVGANLSLRDKNTFNQSELLDLNLTGSVGLYGAEEGQSQFSNLYYEVAGGANLHVHNFMFLNPLLFIIPDKYKRDLSRYSPMTQLSSNLRMERREEYQRLVAGLNLNYQWRNIPFQDRAISRLTPFSLEFIDVPESKISPDFKKRLNSLPIPIRRDFQERFSTRLQFSYTEQNYRSTREHPTFWYRFSAEWGGNLPWLIDMISTRRGSDSSSNDNLLFNRFYYGQYLKGSAEGRLFVPVSRRTEAVFRASAGISSPYNQTPAVPQESRFFSGGTNGMRGWQSNTLGPGRSRLSQFQGNTPDSIVSSLIAPGGEYMLELNAEFRFDVSTYVEMALFSDLGNVWFSRNTADRLTVASSALSWQNLRLGWDVGAGLRFDFSFLVLRLDLGQQIYAPDLETGWVFKVENGDLSRLQGRTRFNLGIGYPF
ncbi:MAG: outer membrane protein assembly factor [Bacteroidetes bacterium]|nr:MAG: outer membrane protein assembly factor [Bacteroidota bacterium]